MIAASAQTTAYKAACDGRAYRSAMRQPRKRRGQRTAARADCCEELDRFKISGEWKNTNRYSFQISWVARENSTG